MANLPYYKSMYPATLYSSLIEYIEEADRQQITPHRYDTKYCWKRTDYNFLKRKSAFLQPGFEIFLRDNLFPNFFRITGMV